MPIIGMRFVKDGPLIPGDLLEARDQGRVVFFCGAGVSLSAGLPDFVNLTENVCTSLSLRDNNKAKKLFSASSKIEKEEEISGIVSMDRVFGFLEQEFGSELIERKVAEELAKKLRQSKKTNRDTNTILRNHTILRDLATTREGWLQLVTTNFDRLFTDVSPNASSFVGPNLPDLSEALNAIVYLHGRADKKYKGAERGGFVLSSASFGRAYLAQGWATDFFKKLIAYYIVVFVGYTANDPPMSYLLEALNASKAPNNGVYAFHSGTADDGNAQWEHKGVIPICYDPNDDHSLLWDTLKSWSERANDLSAWQQSVIDKALDGPETLAPFERNQVAHLVSTVEGAEKFATNNPPPPAEWLCVFDSKCRYGEEQSPFRYLKKEMEVIKPFTAYALDSDVQQEIMGRQHLDVLDELIRSAWSVFRLTNADWQKLDDNSIPEFCENPHLKHAKLPIRIHAIGCWLAKVCDKGVAVWWAAKQGNLHHVIKFKIEETLYHINPPDVINQAWKLLFDIWEKELWDAGRSEQILLNKSIKKIGWTDITLRRFIAYTRAYLRVKRHSTAMPLTKVETIADIMDVEIVYPDFSSCEVAIPDNLLPLVIHGLRQNLEYVDRLIDEVNTYGGRKIFDKEIRPSFSSNNETLTLPLLSQVCFFMDLFKMLIVCDRQAARIEFDCWSKADNNIFAELRVWAAGIPDFLKPSEAGDVLLSLSNTAFWLPQLRRDLCLVLKEKWNSLNKKTRKKLELKIIKGREIWPEYSENIEEKRAAVSLDLLEELRKSGYSFILDIESEMNRLKALAPLWKAEYANPTKQPSSGLVHFNKGYEALLNIHLKDVLKQALKQTDAPLVQSTPFIGLSEERPLKALLALYYSSKYEKFHPEWAWRDFLTSEARERDNDAFIRLIARVLLSLPIEGVKPFFPSACHWLEIIARKLANFTIDIFDKLIERFVDIAIQSNDFENSETLSSRNKDRVIDEAINSPIWPIYKALLKSPKLSHSKNSKIPAEYKKAIEKLLAPYSPTRCYSVCLLCNRIQYFYYADPMWTTENLLPFLQEQKNNYFIAAWDGLLGRGVCTDPALFRQISTPLLELAKDEGWGQRIESLSWLVFWGWIFPDPKTKKPFISDSQLQDLLVDVSENFRVAILRRMCDFLEKAPKETQQNSRYKKLPKLFQTVWPQALDYKSDALSRQLIFIPFSDPDRYSQWVDVIFPYLGAMPSGFVTMELLPNYFGNFDDIIKKYPKKTLQLMHKILAPLDIKQWPYKTKETLASLLEADGSLKNDPQFKELNNRLFP